MAPRSRKNENGPVNGAARHDVASASGNSHTLVRSDAAAPAVHAKELKNVRLLVERDHRLRWDRLPFFVGYSMILATAATDVLEGKW
jgi:hypothetical protein